MPGKSITGTDRCYSGGGVSAAESILQAHSVRTPRDFLNEEILAAYGLTKSTFDDASDGMTKLACRFPDAAQDCEAPRERSQCETLSILPTHSLLQAGFAMPFPEVPYFADPPEQHPQGGSS